jgi:inosine/xanthosine triphosphatase
MKIIAVGSKNPSKLEAVRSAFQAVWPNEEWQALGVDVKSGVSDQPMSDEESIRGATQRARLALEMIPEAEYSVGLEGGIQKLADQYFDCGWVVVMNGQGELGIGSSAKMPVPAKIMELVFQGTELGFADDQIFGKEMSKHGTGHFGSMTNDVLTRSAAYKDGLVAALSRFIHPDLF